MSRRKVSLSNELHVWMESIGGLQSLTRQWIDSFGQEPQIPDQLYALLTLLMDRVRLMDRAVRGTIDPHLVWSRQNDTRLIPGDHNEEDVILSAWSERKLARHHRRAWQSMKRRLGIIKSEKAKRKDETNGS